MESTHPQDFFEIHDALVPDRHFSLAYFSIVVILHFLKSRNQGEEKTVNCVQIGT